MKEEILGILLRQHGGFVSGEAMSTALGVSRAAVWKYIHQLRGEGYEIDSGSNKGYSLVKVPDVLDKALIRHRLSTMSIGHTLEVYAQIDSTNVRARELAHTGSPHGTLVVAEEQLHGKGRMGRSWVSPPGTGIWMSCILRPHISPQEAHRMTVLAALGVTQGILKTTGLRAGIKWPNDIILGTRKVCGILTEMQADPDTIEYIVLGMGVNVNQTADQFPMELTHSATSMSLEAGRALERISVMAEILQAFENLYEAYQKDPACFSEQLAVYKEQSVTLYQRVRVMGRMEEFEGTVIDITDDCSLLVRLDDGTERRVLSGDVSVRGIAGYV